MKAEEFFKHMTGIEPRENYRIGADGCVDLMEKYANQSAQAKDELIKELDSYIKFIGKELSSLEVFAAVHGIITKSEKVEEGKRRREKINALRIAAGIKTE